MNRILRQLQRKRRHMQGPPVTIDKNWRIHAHRSAYLAHKAYGHDNHKHFANYMHKPHWSDDRVVVHGTPTGDLHIAIRGSDFLSLGRGLIDLANDMMIATGTQRYSPEFNAVKKRVNDIIDFHKYKHGTGTHVSISGHSLGGSIVSHIMEDPEIRDKIDVSHSFNPGAGIQFSRVDHPKHHHIHHNAGDIVNFSTRGETGASWHYHPAHYNNPLSNHWNEDWDTHRYWHRTYDADAQSSSGFFYDLTDADTNDKDEV